MNKFITRLKQTYRNNTIPAISFTMFVVVVGLLLSFITYDIFVAEFLFSIGGYEFLYSSFGQFLSIVYGIIVIAIISRFIPIFSWFWFPDQDKTPPTNTTKTVSKNMSGSNLKDEITGAFKAYNSSKHLPVDKDGFAVPRPLPKGAKIDKAFAATMTLSIPAVRKWWFWLPIAVLVSGFFFVVVPLGGYLGIVEGTYTNSGRWNPSYWNPLPSIVLFAALLFIVWWVWNWVYPRLTFTIRKESITVNGVKYRPELSDGLRVGYEMKGTAESALESGLISKEAGGSGFKTLRYTYGAWGEDLPFAVNGYHAEEYVIWINNMIKQFNAPAPKENAPEAGRKKAEF